MYKELVFLFFCVFVFCVFVFGVILKPFPKDHVYSQKQHLELRNAGLLGPGLLPEDGGLVGDQRRMALTSQR